jgi:hypothetical protein
VNNVKRITITVSSEVDLKFRQKASRLYQFEKGWYSKAVSDAMESWADEDKTPHDNFVNIMNSISPEFWEKLKIDLNLDEENPFENMDSIINYFEEENDYSLKIDRDIDNIVIGLEKSNEEINAKNLDSLMLLHIIITVIITSLEKSTHDKYEISGVENIPKVYLRKV